MTSNVFTGKALTAAKKSVTSSRRSAVTVCSPSFSNPFAKKAVPPPPPAKKGLFDFLKKDEDKKTVTKKTVAKKNVAKKPVAKKPVAKKPVQKKTVATKGGKTYGKVEGGSFLDRLLPGREVDGVRNTF
eukprot:CAMPEP_0196571576 /NCGR_PEP_ID=MMETSP1081-20130531/1735_1 /TAXON_ID=36882 /ORGANISM="Pyramimonas amylifera, Strain CCMP720" /LENGTH=128 /DNA_ID=CAMNT_0041888577 /DNA_START=79 /DNA_END=465 /DNA_ORIENTATION=-